MNKVLEREPAATADSTQTHRQRESRKAEVVAALGAVLPAHAILSRGEDTVPYECDGLTAYRETPLVVVLPETEAQVAQAERVRQLLADLRILTALPSYTGGTL